jgi:hypothetical protein
MPFATLYAARVPWSGDREANAGLDGQRVGGHGAVLRRSQAVRRPLPRSNPRSGWAPLPRSLGLPTGALLAGLGSMGDFTGRWRPEPRRRALRCRGKPPGSAPHWHLREGSTAVTRSPTSAAMSLRNLQALGRRDQGSAG